MPLKFVLEGKPLQWSIGSHKRMEKLKQFVVFKRPNKVNFCDGTSMRNEAKAEPCKYFKLGLCTHLRHPFNGGDEDDVTQDYI